MSALANHAFAKMNGIGNEIVVVDMRDSTSKVTPDDARAVASARGGVPYDQLMVLQKPRFDLRGQNLTREVMSSLTMRWPGRWPRQAS